MANLQYKNSNLEVPFGMRDGRIYEPHEVVSGLKCGCTCPGCGTALVAEANILHRLGPQQFLILVPGLAGALAVFADVRGGGGSSLAWTFYWPSKEQAEMVAKVFRDIYGSLGWWFLVAEMVPTVRRQEQPDVIMAGYVKEAKGAFEHNALRRFLLAAGFVQLTNE